MNEHGNRTRQQVTLTLYEYVEDVYLTEKSAAKRRRNRKKVPKTKSGAKAKRITVKHAPHKAGATAHTLSTVSTSIGGGEDLLTIAARELGDADRWVEIAQLNGLRDPRAIEPGQAIRLP
jgi:nucleoid-associated protein YgaU